MSVSHVVSNYSTRETLFGSTKHSIYSRTDTIPKEKVRTFGFTINFVDSCRSAKIIEQTVQASSPIYRADKEAITIAKLSAYTDTLDQAQTYSKGICGEKLLVLDPDTTPKFLTV